MEPMQSTQTTENLSWFHAVLTVYVSTELNDEKKNNLIFKTLKKGYKIQAAEDKTIYLKKALVKVYEYKKKEDNINIEKTWARLLV